MEKNRVERGLGERRGKVGVSDGFQVSGIGGGRSRGQTEERAEASCLLEGGGGSGKHVGAREGRHLRHGRQGKRQRHMERQLNGQRQRDAPKRQRQRETQGRHRPERHERDIDMERHRDRETEV